MYIIILCLWDIVKWFICLFDLVKLTYLSEKINTKTDFAVN